MSKSRFIFALSFQAKIRIDLPKGSNRIRSSLTVKSCVIPSKASRSSAANSSASANALGLSGGTEKPQLFLTIISANQLGSYSNGNPAAI